MAGNYDAFAKNALDLGLKVGGKALASSLPSLGLELPSLSGVATGALGAGAGTAVAGALAALGPAGLVFAVMKMLASLPKDRPVNLGGGKSTVGDPFIHDFGRSQEVSMLDELFQGDGGWYAGGDKTKTTPLDTTFGSMRQSEMIPFYAMTGAPYSTPELAVNSGRQVSRQQMGLPVDLEDIPHDYEALTKMLQEDALPVWDAERSLLSEWDQMIDIASTPQDAGGAGGDSRSEAFYQGLSDREKEFFDAKLRSGMMFAYTGKGSPDFGTIKDYNTVDEEVEKTLTPPPSNGDDVMANMKKNSYLARELGASGEDEIAAVIEPWEAELLKMLGGKGTIDPKSGVLEFETPLDDIFQSAPADFFSRMTTTSPELNANADSGSIIDSALAVRGDDNALGQVLGPVNTLDGARNWDGSLVNPSTAQDLEVWRGIDDGATAPSVPRVHSTTRPALDPNFIRGGNPGNLRDDQEFPSIPSTNTTGKPYDLMAQFLQALGGATSTVAPPAPGTGPIAGYQGISWGNRPGPRLDYIDTHGVVPFAKYNTGENNTEFMFMPNDMNATTRKTLEAINTLSDEDFGALAEFLGYDPQNEWADEAIYNYFGTHKDEPVAATYGPNGWTYTNPDSMPSALESGNYLYRGADISMADILSGDIPSQAALELAWAAGANQEDIAHYAKTWANDQLGGKKLDPNSPEFTAARVRAENSTPIFNSYMAAQQAKEAARMSGGNPLRGGTGAVGSSAPAPIRSAGSQSNAETFSFDGYKWRSDQTGEYYSQEGRLIPVGNNIFIEEGTGYYRDGQNKYVNANGTPLLGINAGHGYGLSGFNDILRIMGGNPETGVAPGPMGAKPTQFTHLLTQGDKSMSLPSIMTGTNRPAAWGGTGTATPPIAPGRGGGDNTQPGGGDGGATDGNDDPGNILDRILAAYPGDYASTLLGPETDDAFIAELLASERMKAQDVINRARASGQLTDVGANTALQTLLGPQSSTAQATLEELSGGILGESRQDINDIIAELVDRASIEPNVSFDPYNARINSLVQQRKTNYMGELLRALGSNSLFDTASLINAGGMAQSPVSGNSFNPAMMF